MFKDRRLLPWSLILCLSLSRQAKAHEEPESSLQDTGFRLFLFDDFGATTRHSLRSVAFPWPLAATALLLQEAPKRGLPLERASLRPILEQYGLIYPDQIVNAGPDLRTALEKSAPLGPTQKRLRGTDLLVQNNGCAMCHAGRLHDATGQPTNDVWLGLPNGSIDFERYGETLVASLRASLANRPLLWREMTRLFPEMSRRERLFYRAVVLRAVRKDLEASQAKRERPLPFDAGEPGITNGVAALKLQLGLIDRYRFAPSENALTSIPAIWDRAFRNSLLIDGSYRAATWTKGDGAVSAENATADAAAALAPIVSFFTLPSAGSRPEAAERAIPAIAQVMRSFHSLEPPPFPRPVDAMLARQGSEIFQTHCEECHGRYVPRSRDGRVRLVWFPNRLVSINRIGTSAARAEAIDALTKDWLLRNPRHPLSRNIRVLDTHGYVAPILSGLWATAPYLHNGSVPTLDALVNPPSRPQRFMLGGHGLDYDKVGVALEPGDEGVFRYPSWVHQSSRAIVYDTSRPGRSNAGHEQPFVGLSLEERRALLEFLKTL